MENKKLLVVCGDSFNYGIGCTDLYTKPYGPLTAKHFDWDLVRLARGSASNFTIYLQGAYAATMNPKPHLIILGTTSYDRIEWVATGEKLTGAPTALDINYHLYPPHYHTPPLHDKPMDFFFKDNAKYSPKILSEQVVAFSDYLNYARQHQENDYYKRMHTESIEKLEMIERYYFEVFDTHIKRDYDRGVILMAYRIIKQQGINCIICSGDTDISKLVDHTRDYFNPDWGKCTRLWPDTVNSLHTGDGGHADISERLVAHIKGNGFV